MSHFRDENHAWVRSQQFYDVNLSDLLALNQDWISQSSSKEERPKAWLMDLDSTLFCVATRFQRIYEKFLRMQDTVDARLFSVVPTISSANHTYSVAESFYNLISRAFQGNLPLVEELFQKNFPEFRVFWEQEFFCDRHIQFDQAYPGAAEFVKKIKDQKIEIIYLTGRDRMRSSTGTLWALKNQGFPTGQGTRLVMKPHATESDSEFKYRAANILNSQFQILATIDNEPENLFVFSKALPHSEIVFFHSIMSRRNPPDFFKKILGDRKIYRLKSFKTDF